MEQLLRSTNIWDLHIHTPLGTPTKKNYEDVSTEKFIDTILDIYNHSTNKMGMISFTDHNKINADAYEMFMKKSEIAIIPGIEVDVYLSEKDKYSKHIIFYFEESELQNIRQLKKLIEDYIESNEKVIFEDFVMYLVTKHKKFVVSPHAFKQGKRGINYEWSDEERASRGANEFTGLIFPFWEATGRSDICKAIEFLNEQYNDENNIQAVIAFSDSADYKKIQDYINKPNQYFRCLNSFKGLLLAGSDPDRIIYENENRPSNNPSEKIKVVRLSNDLRCIKADNLIEIEFSDRLNVIVGGRGKGKSALLDAIVYSLNENIIEDRSRRDFVKKFHVETTNFNGGQMPSDIKFLYFSQSYISKLFDGESHSKLESFFKKEFEHNSGITEGIADLQAQMQKKICKEVVEDININDEFSNFLYLDVESVYLQVRKSKEKVIQLNKENESYFEIVKRALPDDNEIWDEQLCLALRNFTNMLVEKICIANYKNKIDVRFPLLMKKKIDEVKRKKNKKSKTKIDSKKKVEQKLRFLYNKELERIRQINKLYEIDQSMTCFKMQEYEARGEGNNRFYFVSAMNKEHPVEYARRIIVEAVNKLRLRGFDKKDITYIFRKYATTNDLLDKLKDSVDFNDIIENIDSLVELKSEKVQKIIYVHGGEYTDLHKTSPGTQTNAVMEYILHSESTIPLFIDQPEDNIDNEARYAQLTKWIRRQKYERQIILVTHDANIVINGDAENVIIANHTGEKFEYSYGALEYEDILDKAAVILDGGKIAIHRRILTFPISKKHNTHNPLF